MSTWMGGGEKQRRYGRIRPPGNGNAYWNQNMKKWFREIAAGCDLPEEVTRQLRDVGYVVIEGPVVHSKCAQLAEAYDAAVLAAHPDDVSIRSSTRIHDFVNRGHHFDEL